MTKRREGKRGKKMISRDKDKNVQEKEERKRGKSEESLKKKER